MTGGNKKTGCGVGTGRALSLRRGGKGVATLRPYNAPTLIVFTVIALLSISCTKPVPSTKPLIALSIPPQTWFAKQIGQDKIDILLLAGEGQDPHDYEPTQRQLASLQTAGLWVLSGTEFEVALQPKIRAMYPGLTIINGIEGIKLKDGDRHTWLGREPAKNMTRIIEAGLSFYDRANEELYNKNMHTTLALIDKTFDELKIKLAPLKGSVVFVYHPAFGYFFDEFGITQIAVETGGKEPTARQLSALITRAKVEKPAAIFVQKQFPATAARTIADSVGAAVVELDPLAEDWLGNIQKIGEALLDASKQ
ncbi:MAG: zinc ABC transporter substrate-binding protein [Spirochaetaceae bacterium]|jgi:zinc transport system substrate-binding protein|nr:zinc ABC transporter substrate-binding protein [Spirochaetaceae bacterium]